MEIAFIYLLCYFSIAVCHFSGKTTQLVHAIELPNYKVVRSDSDFEIRLYSESSWMSASVGETSFNLSTEIGFHRLYQYIHGANLNSAKLAFTAPVLTSIAPSSSSSSRGNINYTVRFYISTTYQGKPPQPNPELKLHLDMWNSHCVAVRKFSGFARDDNIDKEVEALVSSINKQIRWEFNSYTRQGFLYHCPVQCFQCTFWEIKRSLDKYFRIQCLGLSTFSVGCLASLCHTV